MPLRLYLRGMFQSKGNASKGGCMCLWICVVCLFASEWSRNHFCAFAFSAVCYINAHTALLTNHCEAAEPKLLLLF